MVVSFKIGDYEIFEGCKPFIIAEMSGNHNHSLDRALEIVEAAAKAGADALKIQTYTADTITLDCDAEDFVINDEKSLWNGRKLHELYDEAHTPWDWHKPIFDKAKELGILCFSSPFDESAVDFLEELDAPLYKIASFESTHIPLIKKAASTGKPIIISTGIASEGEIAQAVEAVKSTGNDKGIILKCTSAYPADASDANLRTINDMQEKFDVHVGLSDHTMGIGVAVASTIYGAVAIEKHFTLNRADGGVDSEFSLEPAELQSLVVETERAWKAQGEVRYSGTEREQKSRQFRQSIYVSEDVKTGDVLTEDNIKICRPGFGLEPKFYEEVIGKKFTQDAEKGTRLSREIIDG